MKQPFMIGCLSIPCPLSRPGAHVDLSQATSEACLVALLYDFLWTCIEPSPRLKNVFSRVKLGLVHVLVTEP